MVLKRHLHAVTEILLAEATKVQRIMLPTGADVVHDDVVVSDLIALLGMIPEPADVLDAFAVVVDEGIVDGDDAVVAVARRGVLLEEVQAAAVDLVDVPVGVGKEAVEARLVGVVGELPVNAGQIVVFGHVQAGEVFGEMATLRLVGEEVAEYLERLLNHLRELDDAGHGRLLAQGVAPLDSVQVSMLLSAES